MQLETLYQELAHGAEIIPALTLSVTQEQARLRPAPDSWSLLEVVCHLYDIEREDFRPRLEITLHRPGEKWTLIDPPSWIEGRGYNQRDLAESLEGWLRERAKSLAWLESLKEPDWEAEYSDPYGTMKAGELLASWVAHDNLHTRQLVDLRRARLVGLTQPYETGYAGEW
jgi:hypothetical protein